MTIKEFYEWAIEHGYENYEMGNYFYNGYEKITIDYFEADKELKRVTTDYEC